MSTVQELLLLSAVVVASVMAISTLYSVVLQWSGKGEYVSRELADRTVREICIRSVYSGGGDTNIYVSAVLGELDLGNVAVYVDGADANVLSHGILRDSGRRGIFDGSPVHQDLAYVEVSGNVLDGNVHTITVCVGKTCSTVKGKTAPELSNC